MSKMPKLNSVVLNHGVATAKIKLFDDSFDVLLTPEEAQRFWELIQAIEERVGKEAHNQQRETLSRG
ncbi:MAG: hypothetical protein AB1631_30620 [Acidobacteriota bacterium]